MRKNSMKNTRINGEVQRVLAEVIRGEIKDPRISPLTSVVAVEVAPASIDDHGNGSRLRRMREKRRIRSHHEDVFFQLHRQQRLCVRRV